MTVQEEPDVPVARRVVAGPAFPAVVEEQAVAGAGR
jgi:hypothetical protein